MFVVLQRGAIAVDSSPTAGAARIVRVAHAVLGRATLAGPEVAPWALSTDIAVQSRGLGPRAGQGGGHAGVDAWPAWVLPR